MTQQDIDMAQNTFHKTRETETNMCTPKSIAHKVSSFGHQHKLYVTIHGFKTPLFLWITELKRYETSFGVRQM